MPSQEVVDGLWLIGGTGLVIVVIMWLVNKGWSE